MPLSSSIAFDFIIMTGMYDDDEDEEEVEEADEHQLPEGLKWQWQLNISSIIHNLAASGSYLTGDCELFSFPSLPLSLSSCGCIS